ARGSDGRRSQRVRSVLVVAEVSLAVVLLVGAGLMIHSVQKLTTLDPGFDPESVLTLRVSIPRAAAPPNADPAASPPPLVVVVSERVATRFWPGQDPIGKRIKTGGATANSPWLSIVGAVGEVKYRGLPENPTADPDLYFPFLDRNQQVSLVLRTSVPPATI